MTQELKKELNDRLEMFKALYPDSLYAVFHKTDGEEMAKYFKKYKIKKSKEIDEYIYFAFCKESVSVKEGTYTLIKKYPGSAEIGSQCFFNGLSYIQPLEIGCKIIPKDEVENNPEFWEKVEKKEYWEELWKKYNPRISTPLIPSKQLITNYGESAWNIEQFMKLCLAEKISESLFRELVRYEFEECFNKLKK